MRTDPPGTVAQATRLLNLWRDLARQHVTMGGGCACGVGGVSVRLEDFEHDIADYLLAQAEGLEDSAVLDWLCGYVQADTPAPDEIGQVLQALSTPAPAVDERIATWVLGRLDRTLTSFARLHGGRGAGA